MSISPNMLFTAGSGVEQDRLISEDLRNYVQIGDLVISPDSCPNIPLPFELRDWLSYRTAFRIHVNFGHTNEISVLNQKIGDIEKDLAVALSPRVENEEKIIMDKEALGWRFW